MNDFGFLSNEDIDLYCKPGGKLGCHPDYGVPGIGASTGSLGHGMGIATGIAQSFKISNSDSIVYLVIAMAITGRINLGGNDDGSKLKFR